MVSVRPSDVDKVLDRIKEALKEGTLTPTSLKIYLDIHNVAEKSVEYLKETRMICVDSVSGEISLNEETPYSSFEEAYLFYMPLWEKSLEALHVDDPQRFDRFKDRLRAMPAEDLRQKSLVTLYAKIFEREAEAGGKIKEIKEAVLRDSEMSICDIKPYCEYLTEEMLLFILLFRQEPTEAVPYGFIGETEAIGFFKRLGYGREDVRNVLREFCGTKILREVPKSEEKRYAVIDGPKIVLGDVRSEKKNTILDRKIKSLLGQKEATRS